MPETSNRVSSGALRIVTGGLVLVFSIATFLVVQSSTNADSKNPVSTPISTKSSSASPSPVDNQPFSGTDLNLSENLGNAPLIARLTVKSAGIENLPITIGTDDEILDTGVAGAYPWSGPGEPGVFSVTAHRVGAGGPFLNLDRVSIGDKLSVESQGGEFFSYRVISTEIVEPSDTQVLRGPANESRLVLITCTPIETYADRLVVTAVLES
jgi:LPXTG-site transpeptidase (sortase) family protein